MSSVKDEEQLARDRRASRKAAAACLARQRHKSFVNNLSGSAEFVRYRCDVYRARKGHLDAVAANLMLQRLEDELPEDKRAQLRGWLKGCAARPGPRSSQPHPICALFAEFSHLPFPPR